MARNKMLPDVVSYVKNVGKSVSYVALDHVKERTPGAGDFVETNQDLFKEIYSATKNYRSTLKKVKVGLRQTKIYQAADVGKKALLEDLKSGKFYNREREEKLGLESMGMGDFDDDMDFDFGDDDFGDDGFEREEASNNRLASKISEAVGTASEAQSNVIADGISYVVEVNKANSQMAFVQTEKLYAQMTAGFAGVRQDLNIIKEHIAGPLQAHMQNSKTFFEESTRVQKENNAILKEMLEMQKNLYKKAQVERKESAYDNIIGASGMPDLKEYGKNIKKNAKNFIGPEADLLLGGEGNMLLSMVGSPLKFIPKALMNKIIPKAVDKAMSSFDEGISTLFSTMVARMNHWASDDSDSGMLKYVGQLLGITIDKKTSIDTGKFERGPVPFDGITKKSIVEVIPAYLRRIESAITGQEENFFDMRSGKWKGLSAIQKEKDSIRKDAVASATYDLRASLDEYVTELKKSNKEQAEAFLKSAEQTFNQIYDDFGNFRPYLKESKHDEDSVRGQIFGVSDFDAAAKYGWAGNEEGYKIFRDLLMQNKSAMRNLAGRTLSERQRESRRYREEEATDNGLLAQLYNDRHTNTKKPRVGGLGGVDKYGHDSLFYLRSILAQVALIRTDGPGGGSGGKGRRGRGRGPSGPNVNPDRFLEDLLGDRINEAAVNAEGDPNKTETRSQEDIYQEMMERQQAEKNQRTYKSDLDRIGKTAGFDPDAPLLDSLLGASSVGQKWKIIQSKLNDLTKKPGAWLAATLNKADQRLYDLVFGVENDTRTDGQGNRIKGMLGYMSIKINETFDNLLEGLKKNFLDPIKNYMDRLGISDKLNKAKQWVGDKLSPYTNAIKSKFKQAGRYTKESVQDVAGGAIELVNGMRGKYDHGQNLPVTDASQLLPMSIQERLAAGGVVDDRDISIYNKSENEERLAEKQKYYDEVFKVGGRQDRQRNKYFEDFYSDLFKDVPESARGRLATKRGLTMISPGELIIPSSFDSKKQNKDLNAEKLGKNKIMQALSNQIGFNAKGNIDWKSLGGDVKDNRHELVGSGVVGAAISTVLGVVGGPLLGAAVGAGGTLLARSKTMQKLVLGDEMNEGMVSKKTQEIVKKYAPDMMKGGVVGTILSMVTPLGPLGGLALGAGAGLLKNSDSFKKTIFGEEDDPDSGIIKKAFRDKLKKAAPKMLTGAVAGVLGGPFGLLGNAALGAGVGYLTTTDKFNELLLGKEGEDGKRTGGLANAIKDNILTPLKEKGKELVDEGKDALKKHIVEPLKRFTDPFTQMIKNGLNDIGGFVKNSLNKLFERTIGIPLDELMKNMTKKFSNFLLKILNKPLKALGKIVTAPFRALGGVGDVIRSRQISKGTAVDMTAAERLQFADRRKMGNYKSREMDEMLSLMDVDKLSGIQDGLGQLIEGGRYGDTRFRDSKKALGSSVADFLNNNTNEDGKSLMDAFGYKNYKFLMQQASGGDLEAVQRALGVKGRKNRGLDATKQQELYKLMTGQVKDIQSYKNMRDERNINRDQLRAQLEEQFGRKISESQLNYLYKNIGREVKGRKPNEAFTEGSPQEEATGIIKDSVDRTGDRIVEMLVKTNKILGTLIGLKPGDALVNDTSGMDGNAVRAAESMLRFNTAEGKNAIANTKAAAEWNDKINNSIEENAKLKDQLSKAFGIESTISDLSYFNKNGNKVRKVIDITSKIDGSAVDDIIKLEIIEFNRLMKLGKFISFKIDSENMPNILKNLSNSTLGIVKVIYRCGFRFKNAEDLIKVMISVRDVKEANIITKRVNESQTVPEDVQTLLALRSGVAAAVINKKSNVTKKYGGLGKLMDRAGHVTGIKNALAGLNNPIDLTLNPSGEDTEGEAKDDKEVQTTTSKNGHIMTYINGVLQDDSESVKGRNDNEEAKLQEREQTQRLRNIDEGTQSMLGKMFGTVKEKGKGLFERITGMFGNLGGIGKTILGFLGVGAAVGVLKKTGLWEKMTEWIGPKLQAVGGWLLDTALPKLGDLVVTGFTTILPALAELIGKGLKSVGGYIIEGLKGILPWNWGKDKGSGDVQYDENGDPIPGTGGNDENLVTEYGKKTLKVGGTSFLKGAAGLKPGEVKVMSKTAAKMRGSRSGIVKTLGFLSTPVAKTTEGVVNAGSRAGTGLNRLLKNMSKESGDAIDRAAKVAKASKLEAKAASKLPFAAQLALGTTETGYKAPGSAAGAGAKGAAEGATKTGILAQIRNSLKSSVDNLFKDSTIVKLASKVKSGITSSKLVKAGQEIVEVLMKKLATSTAAKITSAFGKQIAKGLPIVAPIVIAGYVGSGMLFADNTLGLTKKYMSFSRQLIGTALYALYLIPIAGIILELIGIDVITSAILDIFLPAIGITDTAIQRDRELSKQEVKDWNLNNPNRQFDTVQEYNNYMRTGYITDGFAEYEKAHEKQIYGRSAGRLAMEMGEWQVIKNDDSYNGAPVDVTSSVMGGKSGDSANKPKTFTNAINSALDKVNSDLQNRADELSGAGMDSSDSKKIDDVNGGKKSIFGGDFWKNKNKGGSTESLTLEGKVQNIFTNMVKVGSSPMAIVNEAFNEIDKNLNKTKSDLEKKSKVTNSNMTNALTSLFSKNADSNSPKTIKLVGSTSKEEANKAKYNEDGTIAELNAKGRGGAHVYQNSPGLANIPYGGSTLGEVGCGPVAATNLISSLRGSARGTLLDDAMNYAEQNRYANSSGTDIDYFKNYLGTKGIPAENTTSKSATYNALKSGKPAVLLGTDKRGRAKAFGDSMHYINAKGLDRRGNMIVEDPDLPGGSYKYPADEVLANMDAAVLVGKKRTGGNKTISPATIINIAQKEVGTRIKNGTVKYNEAYYGHKSSAAWCAAFIWWCFREAGAEHLWTKSASCGELMNWASKNNMIVDNPQQGDIFIVDFGSGGKIQRHTGIVKNVTSKTKIRTIEGNTSSVSQNNGGWVEEKDRDVSGILKCYIRPNYNGSQTVTGHSLSSDSTASSEASASNTLFDQIANTGKSIMKSMYGENVVNALFGDSEAAVSAETASSEQTITGTAEGKNNQEKIWNYFKSQGINPKGIAGLMGNFQAESNLNPATLENAYNTKLGVDDDTYTSQVDSGQRSATSFANDKAGYGLAQWTYHTRKQGLYDATRSKSKSIADIAGQLDYAMTELNKYPELMQYLKGDGVDIKGATNWVMNEYEKPAVKNLNARVGFAENIYKDMTGGRRTGLIASSRKRPVAKGRSALTNTGATIRRQTGSANTSDLYVGFLRTIVDVLLAISDNTESLGQIVQILSDNFNIKINPQQVQNAVGSARNARASARKAIDAMVRENGGSNISAVGNLLQNKDTSYLVEAMTQLARE